MKTQEIMNVHEPAPKRVEGRRIQRNLAEVVGEALGLIACMCIAAIVIALTVKFIMWIL